MLNKIKEVIVYVVTHKRVKAYIWGTGAFFAAGLLQIVLQLLLQVDLPNWLAVLIGLALQQTTKWLNTPKTSPEAK